MPYKNPEHKRQWVRERRQQRNGRMPPDSREAQLAQGGNHAPRLATGAADVRREDVRSRGPASVRERRTALSLRPHQRMIRARRASG